MSDALIIADGDYEQLVRLRPPEMLQHELERAIVVPAEELPPDVVTLGSRVAYTDESNGVRRLVTIVLPEEADGVDGRISVLAPVGTALLGLRSGQSIEWEFPDGRLRRLRVDEVVSQPVRNETG